MTKIGMTIGMIFCLLIATAQADEIWASRHSGKYHDPFCEKAQTIKEFNLVKFKNVDEAGTKGYVPCEICNPLNAKNAKISLRKMNSKMIAASSATY